MRLRDEVQISTIDDEIELVDTVTGFRVALQGATENAIASRDGDPSQEPWALFRSVGFLNEGLAIADIESRQLEFRTQAVQAGRESRLKELLQFAVEHVPYFRERAAVYSPDQIRTLADLSKLPIMGKSEVRLNFPQGLVADDVQVADGIAAGRLELAATSGTTSERLQVLSNLELDSVPANYEQVWRLPSSDATPTTAVFTTPTCLGTECHLGAQPFEKRLRAENTLFLNSLGDLFSMSRRFVEAVAAELHRFKPDFLLVNPVYFHWLIRKAREFGFELPKPKLVLSSYQYLSEIQRRAIGEALEAPVYSYYHATDLSGCRLAVECSRGQLHVREDHVLAEIVGADGPKQPGELGSLLVTSLGNRVMPLVRYMVGDVGRLTTARCDCAIAEWATLELHGRMKDMLWLKDRWVTTREFDGVVSQQPGVDFYKALQATTGDITLQIIPAVGASPDLGALRDRVGDTFRTTVLVKEVKRLDPEPSLKFRLTQTAREVPPFI